MPDTAGDAGANTDGAVVNSCADTAPDLYNCACSATTMRACYPASASAATRGIGACKDGMQTCTLAGEFGSYGECTGATTPVTENCHDGIDNNCDGRTDCMDPACSTDPSCSCQNGQTRTCYDGPAATRSVGTCRDGTQTCTNSQWQTTCSGEVLPSTENCSDALDHDCNHLPGCLDLFSCIFSSACQSHCDQTKLDPGCACPQGEGDTALCPAGTVGVTKGGSLTSPGNDECCACKASDCANNTNCCSDPVCAGNSACNQVTCKPLPASCNGMTNFDCDDFPEDCDEPCCHCSSCP